jgi:O-antigen/teichoic acid export membrane protein
MTMLRRLWPLATLYCGRLGTALVGILLLPWFSRLMGPQQFGVVAIVLSTQSLLVALDLGLSIVLGRDLAGLAAGDLPLGRAMFAHAERTLLRLYAGLLVLALVASRFMASPLTAPDLVAVALLFGAVVHQNLGQVALLARQDYAWVGLNQLIGVLLRNAFTLACLSMLAPSLTVFVASQALGACVHALVTRWRLARRLPPAPAGAHPAFRTVSFALLLQTVAGACAMQLDKPLVGAFAGAAATAPYYLATVLALTPLTFLAGPVVQFFQPKVIAQIAARALSPALVRKFLFGILASAFLPGLALWFAAPAVTALWLHGGGEHALVASYVRILVVGTSLGAIGYLPNVLLVARQQYRFLAAASSGLTIAVLALTAWAASGGDVRTVCYVYATYHVAAAVVQWVRALTLDPELRAALSPVTPAALGASLGTVGGGLLIHRFL